MQNSHRRIGNRFGLMNHRRLVSEWGAREVPEKGARIRYIVSGSDMGDAPGSMNSSVFSSVRGGDW
jgi:hypothetical protein